MNDDVFKALADDTRRRVLDALFANDGQSLRGLCQRVPMTRQALSKHLAILERAGLVITHFQGREKLHYLDPAPLYELSSRWISKYAERRVAATAALKAALESNALTGDEQ